QTCQYLEALGVRYKLNESVVRGVYYYTGLGFEWTTDKLGSQSAICAGGRYDGLVENLGGQKSAAIGFAIGMERLLHFLEDLGKLPNQDNACDVFFILD
ncbi:ATP phosphoribosyltransferase regulatory subunit, partial [Francisella tularensis]|uniref:ATP phosphoribosyltransferase regulatory subunit n=1 Tax=Francisella tularensis TaxID=263 RepID=UPI002381C4A4